MTIQFIIKSARIGRIALTLLPALVSALVPALVPVLLPAQPEAHGVSERS